MKEIEIKFKYFLFKKKLILESFPLELFSTKESFGGDEKALKKKISQVQTLAVGDFPVSRRRVMLTDRFKYFPLQRKRFISIFILMFSISAIKFVIEKKEKTFLLPSP